MLTKRRTKKPHAKTPPAAIPGHTRIQGAPLSNDHPLVRAMYRSDVKITDALRKCRIREMERPDGKERWSDGQCSQARTLLEASYPLTDAQREQAAELIALEKGSR